MSRKVENHRNVTPLLTTFAFARLENNSSTNDQAPKSKILTPEARKAPNSESPSKWGIPLITDC